MDAAACLPTDEFLWSNEPCRAACPVHTDAGAYVTAIAEGRYEDAYAIAREHNPFASVCGRICAAPCETACRRGTVDAPVAIRALKRFVTERFGVESLTGAARRHEAVGAVPEISAPSIGIVGGGPAGLAAAHDLRLRGHAVTVYEAADRLGGMMVLGIPEYRLSRALIEREVDAVIDMGVEVRLGTRVGVDVTLTELLERHASVFLATGTGNARDLDLPGHELDGVLRAVEFLLHVNQGFRVELGERVVVVGGGNVAFDAARTALRAAGRGEELPDDSRVAAVSADDAARAMTTTLDVARSVVRAGVPDVTVIALESAEEIPADPEEIDEAEREGIRILHRRGPHRFVGNGHVEALETIAVESVFDSDGRFAPKFRVGDVALLPCDTVILAVGQAADYTVLGDLELERRPNGAIATDPLTLASSDARIFVGGDLARGPRILIEAVADGQRAAAAISRSAGVAVQSEEHRVELVTRPGFRRLWSGYDALGRVAVPAAPIERRVGFAEVELGYGAAEARLEGLRCLRCFDNVMLDSSRCILCGLCVDVCPPGCITIVRADRVDLGDEAQSVLLLDEDRCIRCGLCVNRCPPAALSMVHAKEVVDARRI